MGVNNAVTIFVINNFIEVGIITIQHSTKISSASFCQPNQKTKFPKPTMSSLDSEEQQQQEASTTPASSSSSASSSAPSKTKSASKKRSKRDGEGEGEGEDDLGESKSGKNEVGEDAGGLDDVEVEDKKIILISKEGKRIETTQKAGTFVCFLILVPTTHILVFIFLVKLSKVWATPLEGDPEATEIPANRIEAKTLQLVVEWLNYHDGTAPAAIAKPLISKEMVAVCSDPWDAKFVNRVVPKGEAGCYPDLNPLFDLILAANYVGILVLIQLGSARVASAIKGK